MLPMTSGVASEGSRRCYRSGAALLPTARRPCYRGRAGHARRVATDGARTAGQWLCLCYQRQSVAGCATGGGMRRCYRRVDDATDTRCFDTRCFYRRHAPMLPTALVVATDEPPMLTTVSGNDTSGCYQLSWRCYTGARCCCRHRMTLLRTSNFFFFFAHAVQFFISFVANKFPI